MNPLAIGLANLASRYPLITTFYLNYVYAIPNEFAEGMVFMFIFFLFNEVTTYAE